MQEIILSHNPRWKTNAVFFFLMTVKTYYGKDTCYSGKVRC